MKWFSAIILLLAVSSIQAAQYEFAFLSFPDGGIRWIDKTGKQESTATGQPKLFADLSGQDAGLAHQDQYRILVLNGLSKSGWDLVSVTEASSGPVYLLKHEPGKATAAPASAASENRDTRVDLTITGGHDTDPRDHGRPVVLVAAGLNVPADVFRKAFSNVKPAGPGQEPEESQVRQNKRVLMEALSPYGVDNDRLNEVSNFYRYSSSRGQMWKNTPAAGYATVHDGVVTSITITNPGAGYTTPPKISVAGVSNLNATAVLAFDTDFAKNGSIKEISISSGK